MPCVQRLLGAFALLSAIGMMPVSGADAQSGTRGGGTVGSGSRTAPPGGTTGSPAIAVDQTRPSKASASVALSGYSPVSILDARKWVKGSPEQSLIFDGHRYLFASPAEKQKFQSDPARYVPLLGGDCSVSYVKMGKRTPGSIQHALFYGGRLVLLANEGAKKVFAGNPSQFANSELAFGGNCAVCKVAMHHDMPGKDAFTVFYRGLRYRFPSVQMRDAFLSEPVKYADRGPTAASPSRAGSGTR